MQTIFVDIDGVVADSMAWWLTLYNRKHGSEWTKEDIYKWDVTDILEYSLEPFFDNYIGVLPVEDAFDSLTTLHEKYRIVYATAGLGKQWLSTMYWFPEKDYMVVQDKSLLCGYALIDDNPANLDVFRGTRFLLRQPWNQHRGLGDTTWKQITKYLMEE